MPDSPQAPAPALSTVFDGGGQPRIRVDWGEPEIAIQSVRLRYRWSHPSGTWTYAKAGGLGGSRNFYDSENPADIPTPQDFAEGVFPLYSGYSYDVQSRWGKWNEGYPGWGAWSPISTIDPPFLQPLAAQSGLGPARIVHLLGARAGLLQPGAIDIAAFAPPPRAFPDLLPPNASRLERALDAASERAADLDAGVIADLWNADGCPPPLLSWLAWAVRAEDWDPGWPVEVRRQAVRAGLPSHRDKATKGALADALGRLGSEVHIAENPGGNRHTMAITIYQRDRRLVPSDAALSAIVDRAKRLSVHYSLLHAGGQASLPIGVRAAAAGARVVPRLRLEAGA